MAHTQGKKHQSNLGRRAAKEAKESPALPAPMRGRVDIKKFVKIGRPGYRVTKQFDAESAQQSLLFQVDYPEIGDGIIPRHRFMSAYEQKIEPPDRRWQYVLFAAEPYETIAFKVPSREVDKSEGKFWTYWNKEAKQFFLQFSFKVEGHSYGGHSGHGHSGHGQNSGNRGQGSNDQEGQSQKNRSNGSSSSSEQAQIQSDSSSEQTQIQSNPSAVISGLSTV